MTDGRYYDDGDGRALLSNNLSTSGGLWLWRGEEVPQHFLLEYDCVLLFEGKTQILSGIFHQIFRVFSLQGLVETERRACGLCSESAVIIELSAFTFEVS